jgi:hypothetical protein
VSLIATLVLAAAPAAAPPSPEAGNEIVVIARKMKSWRGNVRQVDGELVCRTKKSTGDRAIDAIRCEAMLACYAPLQPEMSRIAASDLGRAEKKRRMTETAQSAFPCLDQHHEAAVARLAEQRAGR